MGDADVFFADHRSLLAGGGMSLKSCTASAAAPRRMARA